MIHFIFSEKDSRYLFLKYDSPEDEIWLKSSRKTKNPHPNLTDHINLVNPVCYLKTYKGPEYTEDFIFSQVNISGERVYYCSVGLWQDIFKFFRDNNVPYDGLIENQHHLKRKLKHTLEEFKEIVRSWNLSIEPRPYQYEAAYKILQWNRSISELCTRAGKTLIAYMIFRYCIEELGMKRILMIVPSVDLVKQAVSDFSEYKEFFKSEMIWGGGKQVESANFTVGTFQSLIKYLEPTDKKYNPHFFDGYDCVFVDEVHRAKAAQIRSIISQPFMKDVIIGFGMTGTLPQEKTIDHYCLFSLLGAKIQEITTAQLKAAGYISDIEIYQYRLMYNDFELTKKRWFECTEYGIGNYEQVEDLKHPGKMKKVELPEENQNFLLRYVKNMSAGLQTAKQAIYSNPEWSDTRKDFEYMDMLKTIVSDSTGSNSLAIERMMVHMFNERIDILLNEILPRCDKNTLILAHHTVYINHIVEEIKKKFGNTRNVVKITGSVTAKKRDEIKKQFIMLSLYLGQRKENMLAMKWEHVDFENKSVLFPKTKNGEDITVPLVDQAYNILKYMYNNAVSKEWVFPGSHSASGHYSDPKSAWKTLLKQAGLENLRLHDLRRTLGSYQAISGSSLAIIGKSLGHKSVSATQVYARLSMDPVRNSMQNAVDNMMAFITNK